MLRLVKEPGGGWTLPPCSTHFSTFGAASVWVCFVSKCAFGGGIAPNIFNLKGKIVFFFRMWTYNISKLPSKKCVPESSKGLNFEPLSHQKQTWGLKFDTQTEGLGMCVFPFYCNRNVKQIKPTRRPINIRPCESKISKLSPRQRSCTLHKPQPTRPSSDQNAHTIHENWWYLPTSIMKIFIPNQHETCIKMKFRPRIPLNARKGF